MKRKTTNNNRAGDYCLTDQEVELLERAQRQQPQQRKPRRLRRQRRPPAMSYHHSPNQQPRTQPRRAGKGSETLQYIFVILLILAFLYFVL